MTEPLTPKQRQIRSSLAAHTRWAAEPDRAKATRAAREGFYAKLERQVDPNGEFDPDTRRAMAEAAHKAHMRRMSLAASKKRSAKKRQGRAA